MRRKHGNEVSRQGGWSKWNMTTSSYQQLHYCSLTTFYFSTQEKTKISVDEGACVKRCCKMGITFFPTAVLFRNWVLWNFMMPYCFRKQYDVTIRCFTALTMAISHTHLFCCATEDVYVLNSFLHLKLKRQNVTTLLYSHFYKTKSNYSVL